MLGIKFEECNPFLLSFTFEECILNFSSFYQLKIKETKFKNCKMEQVDFTEADLARSMFKNCDLSAAVFSNTNLAKADLFSALNFNIDPELNKITGAKFSSGNLAGLLNKHKLIIK